MPADFIPLFEQKFGVRIMEGYGLTEASPASSFSRLDMPQKPGSIGIPIPGVAAKIVDEEGRELPRETVGELDPPGRNVMKGYYKDEEATAQVIRDGWLHTSDLGRMDGDGYIFLTGRKKRMIITSGFNVYPREIEIVLGLPPRGAGGPHQAARRIIAGGSSRPSRREKTRHGDRGAGAAQTLPDLPLLVQGPARDRIRHGDWRMTAS